jgi:hypothetical protein
MWMAWSGQWASWCWRCFSFGSSQIVFGRPDLGTAGGQGLGSNAKDFSGVKAHHFCANGGDACRCRYPLGRVIVVIPDNLYQFSRCGFIYKAGQKSV